MIQTRLRDERIENVKDGCDLEDTGVYFQVYKIKKVKIEGKIFLYYELIKRELKTRPINECRSDERLNTKDEESTRLGYTGFHGELGM
jgi:hypothetical protein